MILYDIDQFAMQLNKSDLFWDSNEISNLSFIMIPNRYFWLRFGRRLSLDTNDSGSEIK